MGDSEKYILIKTEEADIEVKKSHFISNLRLVKNENEAKDFIAFIRKKYYDARHHCFAMRIGSPEKVFERSGDDGEPQGTAGKPMLEILKGADLYDVCAVVTRYFGGTLLGTGGLVRAYSDSLKEALTRSEKAMLNDGLSIGIVSGYADAEKIKRLAYTGGFKSLTEEYAENCRMNFLVPQKDKEEFLKKVTQLSLGKAEIQIIGSLKYYETDKLFIYPEEK